MDLAQLSCIREEFQGRIAFAGIVRSLACKANEFRAKGTKRAKRSDASHQRTGIANSLIGALLIRWHLLTQRKLLNFKCLFVLSSFRFL